MAKVKIQGHASGTGVLTVTAPNTSTDRTITLPDSTGTILDNTSTLDATKLSGAITTSSLVVNGTNADLTLSASGNNISFARNSDNYITASGGSSSNLILDGQNRIVLKHNGTEKMRVTANGLTFNGDTGAVNALDDYEEGTWTPNVAGDATYSQQSGTYTKVGNIVTAKATMTINAINSSGKNQIRGLPYTSKAGEAFASTVGYYANLSVSPTWIGCYADANNTTVTFIWNTGNSSTIGANGQNLFQNSARIDITVTYQAA